jgi:hypothetical protein
MLVALLIAGIGAAHAASLPEAAATAIQSLLEEHSAVAQSIPAHPHSATLLDEAVTRSAIADRGPALEAVASTFADAPLGLYAFDTLAEDDPARCATLAKDVIDNQPATRLARRCLDFLADLQGTADVYQHHADTPLEAFASLRIGDTARQRGDLTRAERAYVRTGTLAPLSSHSGLAADRLDQLWQTHNRWMASALFSGRDQGLAVPPGVWARYGAWLDWQQVDHAEQAEYDRALWEPVQPVRKTLERFFREADDYPPSWQTVTALRLAWWHLHVGRIDVSGAILEAAMKRLREYEESTPAPADMAVAVFLLGEGSPYQSAPPPDEVNAALERILAIGRLGAAREDFLNTFSGALEDLPPDERVYFGNLLARRHADEGNVARAQLTLVECLEETDVPAWMRAATKAHLLRLRGHAGS